MQQLLEIETDESTISHDALAQASTSSIAIALMFGSIIFATTAFHARLWISGGHRAWKGALQTADNPSHPPSWDIHSFLSWYSLLHNFSQLGLILLFTYICERHPLFPHGERSYDRDFFFFLVAILFVVSFFTLHKNSHETNQQISQSNPYVYKEEIEMNALLSNQDQELNTPIEIEIPAATTITTTIASSTNHNILYQREQPNKIDIMNRHLTEEWKGWMQFIFLLYHYFHAKEVYNAIRVMITCYVWMTGFGNFSFFYQKNDYSFMRILQMLWRLNFLVVFLCLTQNTTYILYYICPLHTFCFLLVYITMRIGHSQWNYSKFGIRYKMLALAFLTYLLWDFKYLHLFQLSHFFLGTNPILGANSGTLWEWYFRTSLDHWSTLLGMIFAFNLPVTALFYQKLESLPPTQCWIGKGIMASTLILIFIAWMHGPFRQNKFVYNTTHAYYGFIPLTTYIFIRNISPTFRSYSFQLLEEIGKITLETYLLQHHIWLTSNSKTLLTLIPGWPHVNLVMVSILYLICSRKAHQLTLSLRGILLPDKASDRFGLKSILLLVILLLFFFALSILLQLMNILSLRVVGIISSILGAFLYESISDLTWSSYVEYEREKGKSFYQGSNQTLSVRRISLSFGFLCLWSIGGFWHFMASHSSGSITSLQRHCGMYIHKGHWVPVRGCTDTVRAAAFTENRVSVLGTCDGGFVWGWEMTPSSSHCYFRRREADELLRKLRNKHLVFIGDSMTRSLYHGFSRQLGFEAAEQTLQKHSNITVSIQHTSVSFFWAPFAADQRDLLRSINLNFTNDKSSYTCDMIIMGGGAWDLLHNTRTDQQRESLNRTLNELKVEISRTVTYETPVVWVIPTCIYDNLLNTDEKRVYMTEDKMMEMRKLYEVLGIISSSSFYIDGYAYTKERINDSYDGAHYPKAVYHAGAQILANSLDWLLEEERADQIYSSPTLGELSSPWRGLCMLILVIIGLFLFDGYLGVSYLASLFVYGIRPDRLYHETLLGYRKHLKSSTIDDGFKTIMNSPLKLEEEVNHATAQQTSVN